MKKLLTCCLLILVLTVQARAQEQPTLQQQADRLYERFEYFKSLSLYLKLANKKKPNVRVLERIADCFRNINRYDEAEAWYARAVIDTAASSTTHYNYAEVLLRNKQFDKAKQQYQLYFKKVHNYNLQSLKLFSCDSASLWAKQPSGYTIGTMNGLNGGFSDWGLNYEGKTGFVFTSDRLQYYGAADNRTGKNWLRLYHTDLKATTVTELPVVSSQTGGYINIYHLGPMALNASADTAYITIATEVPAKEIVMDDNTSQKLYTRRLQLIMAVKQNNQWIETGPLPFSDINQYSAGHAALSKNGRIIYFTSDRPGGFGKTDIWYCEKKPNGTWSSPVNCGPTINTKDEEAFPEIGGDGVLYYSSKGLPGMGGFDIYAVHGEKNSWDDPVNLKSPINSTSDDFCMVTLDGISGYLSSNRQGGKGDDDIYSFNYKKPEPILQSNKPPVEIAKVKPELQPQPTSLIGNDIYGVRNIYYNLDQYNIRPDAADELDRVIVILKQHPTFRLTIASHTDTRASGDYNLLLSQRRSASVVAYLTKHGIFPGRLTTSAYGKTQLLNECADGVNCTEEQQQLNRRTEFRIIPDK